MRVALVVLAACGSPPPAQPIATAAKPPVPSITAPAPVTCGDVGVILRGPVEDPRRAGPAKEAAIANACLHDKWPAAVLTCIAGGERGCLDKLDAAQRAAYQQTLVKWAEEHEETAPR